MKRADKYNTTWLAQTHFDKIDCEFSLNEGGWIIKNSAGKVRYVSISTADKVGVSLHFPGARQIDALVHATAGQCHLYFG